MREPSAVLRGGACPRHHASPVVVGYGDFSDGSIREPDELDIGAACQRRCHNHEAGDERPACRPADILGNEPDQVCDGEKVQHPEGSRNLKLDDDRQPGRVKGQREREDEEQRQTTPHDAPFAWRQHARIAAAPVDEEDDRRVDQVQQPRIGRPLERKKVVFRLQRRQPFRIHLNEPARQRPGDEHPDAGHSGQASRDRDRHTPARFIDRPCDRDPDRKPERGCWVQKTARQHQHRADHDALAHERHECQHSEAERELARMKVAFERVRSGLRDGVPKRQRASQRHRCPYRAVEQPSKEQGARQQQGQGGAVQRGEQPWQPETGHTGQQPDRFVDHRQVRL